jgi:hypothetical protein
MKPSSVIAVVVAAGIGIATAALAQSIEVSGEVSAEVSGEVSTSSTLSSVSSQVSSAVSSVSSQVSSALSSVSSELSSAVSSASSEISSGLSSAVSSMMSSAEEVSCSDLDTSTLLGTALDPATLAAVTSVTVFVVTDCTGLTFVADGAAMVQLAASEIVADALAASGQVGGEVVAYTLDGTSLTVYVRSRNS